MPKIGLSEEEAREAAMQLAEQESRKVRKRPDRTVQADPGDNARYTRHNMELYTLPEISLDDAEQVNGRVFDYFGICERNDMKPSVTALALALGIDRRRLWEIANGKSAKPPAVSDVLKKAYLILNAQMEDYAQNGKMNPVTAIFLMKNHFGYQDKQEIEVSAGQSDIESPEALDEKYRDAIPVDFTEDA